MAVLNYASDIIVPCNKLSCKLWLSTIRIRTPTYCVRKPLLQLVSVRQSLKRLVLARPSPLPCTKTWHRTGFGWVSAGDNSLHRCPWWPTERTRLEDQSWALSALCPGAGLWRDAAVPAGLPQAIGLTDRCTSQTSSSTICLWDSSLHISLYCLLTQAINPLLCWESHQGTELSKINLWDKNKIEFFIPYQEIIH